MKFDKVLGIHEQALKLRAYRSEVLAGNLANADTPGYKARDVDFKGLLQQQTRVSPVHLATTHKAHIVAQGAPVDGGDLKYRTPHQLSLDGNSVEVDVEQVQFTTNAMQYQASLRFLDGRIKDLLTAIKGDG